MKAVTSWKATAGAAHQLCWSQQADVGAEVTESSELKVWQSWPCSHSVFVVVVFVVVVFVVVFAYKKQKQKTNLKQNDG